MTSVFNLNLIAFVFCICFFDSRFAKREPGRLPRYSRLKFPPSNYL